MNDWIAADAANKEYYEQFKLIWNTSKELAVKSTVDENAAWQRFQQKISKSNKETASVRKMNTGWMRIAASLIVVIGVSILGYLLFNKENDPKQLIAQTQENVLTDTLSDGSMVTLNKRSALSFPEKFKGDTRKVTLTGEAFFNIAPNKKKPFIISVNDVQVTVVGTSFNIRSENGNTEVIVETGIVKVTKAGKTIELRPGEKTMIAAADIAPVKQEVTDKLYNYYRTREFVCDNTPLWKVVEVLNEAYDAHIIVEDGVKDLPLTTTFENLSLDRALEVLHETFNITIKKSGDQIILE
ncbi:MAG: FecR domain-containing protein [Chitinophagaceae bacterium]